MKKLHQLLLSSALLIASASVWAAGPLVEVYKSPYCGCCHKWVEHMQKAGFDVRTHDVEDVGAMRARLGMPDQYGSCHTAKVAGYVLEGHVPASDVKRLLRDKPKALGLAVPGMPPASPGMDLAGYGGFDSLIIDARGKSRRFARHTLESAAQLD